jgi:eukaryotic-like serine/threonine-protein kinase
MKQSSWQELELIFNEAIGLPTERRLAFLSTVCGKDKNLYRNVLTLLDEAKKQSSFFSSPVYESGIRLLASEVNGLLEELDFAGYKLLKIIGRGGAGVVFLAEDTRLEREIAIKVLPYTLADDDALIRRFQQEARAASAISHPNVAHIYDFGKDKGRFFLAMEYVDGKTLREIFKKEKLSVAQSLEIAIQIAKALEAAHKKGIVHRDIKPENVILSNEDNTVRVLDFGLAKYVKGNPKLKKSVFSVRTDPKFIIGTTAYMSPEQIYGETLDARTDLWSFGVLLFEMLLGMRPFDGNTPVDIQSNILHSEPPFNSKIEQFSLLKDILLKLLTKQLAERYQTATDLKEDLRIVYRNLSAKQQNLNIHLTCDGETAQPAGNLRTIRQRLEKFIKNILSR